MIVIPNPGDALARMKTETNAMWRPLQLWDSLGKELEKDIGADLLSTKGLAAIGIHGDKPITIIPGFAGDPTVVRLPLSDQKRFDKWLTRWSKGERKSLALRGHKATVMFFESDWPVACLCQKHEAHCQVGLARGDDVLKPLREAALGGVPALASESGVVSAASQVDKGATAYLFAAPRRLAERAAQYRMELAARRHRISPPKIRRQAAVNAKHDIRRMQRSVRGFTGAAFALSVVQDGLQVTGNVALSPLGSRVLNSIIRAARPNDPVALWAETPALARVIVRLQPRYAQRVTSQAGLTVPSDALTGTIALLALGVDTEADAAKKGAPKTASVLPFIVPIAAAVGLTQAVASSSAYQLAGGQRKSAPIQRHTLHGSPIELRAVSGALLVGAGAGSRAAAERRWLRRPQKQRAGRPPFFDLDIDLHAVNAAFASGSYGDETRPELRIADAARRRLAPVLSRYRQVSLRMWSKPQVRAIDLRLSVSR